MPRLMPCKRREFIRKLRTLGYTGPFPGGNHQSMQKGSQTVRVPNTDIDDIDLLKRILRIAKIGETDFINA
jgi:predicted RNA binding protein YcfA (HicA-like mRNA interferase family)